MELKDKSININISTITIVKTLALFLLLYFLFLIKDILAVLFVALILSSALDPWVDWMQDRRIPRALGVFIIYGILFLIMSGAIYLIIPPISEQMIEMTGDFARYADKAVSGYSAVKDFTARHGIMQTIQDTLGSLSSNLQSAAGNIFSTVTDVFSWIFSFFLVLVITFYMIVEENALKKLIWSIAPADNQTYILNLVNRMQKKIGLWLRGQLILSLVIFIFTYTGFWIMALFGINMKYKLILAIIAGITEFVPYLGPMLGAIPAVFLAFAQEPILALFVAALYYSIQWTENNILVPRVMQKMTGLNPLVSISVLLIGFKVAGVAGAILAIPVTTAISVLIGDIFEHKQMAEKTFTE